MNPHKTEAADLLAQIDEAGGSLDRSHRIQLAQLHALIYIGDVIDALAAGPEARVRVEEVWQIAHEAAGAATAPFMQMHPDTVMPDREVSNGVAEVLRQHGFTDPPPGYCQ